MGEEKKLKREEEGGMTLFLILSITR